MTQEVFLALFEDDCRALRAWNPNGGRSIENFVRWFARHQCGSILRSGRRSPWSDTPVGADQMEQLLPASTDSERRVVDRELLSNVVDRMHGQLSARQMFLFQLLFVEDRTVDEVCAETGMKRNAVYQAKFRLREVAQDLVEKLAGDRQ